MRTSHIVPAALLGVLVPFFASGQESPNTKPPLPDPALPSEVATNPAKDQALQNAIPLTPRDILELGERYRDVQSAQESAATVTAVPSNRPAVAVSYAPGQQSNIIQTARGYPTAISFFDNTGAPWPIGWNTNSNAANPGGAKNCNADGNKGGSPSAQAVGFFVCVPVQGSNTIEITPMSISPRGGLLVSLENAPKPLSFILLPGRGVYDDNLSVRVADRGPNAKLEVDTRPGAPVTGEPFMNAMLSGVPPSAAHPLMVEGVSPDEVRAWRMGNETFIRTRYTLMSPAWDGSESGEGGMTIYALPNTPVVLLSVADRTVSASLKETE